MASGKTLTIRHIFGGAGWDTDTGPTVDVSPDSSGKIVVPYLVDAEDCLFELSGAPHKIGGTTKGNSSALGGGAAIAGLYDYWRQGTVGTQARRRVVHVSTVIMADNDDYSFANIGTGFTADAVPAYFTFDDFLIISSDASADVPKSWDQTTFQSLAGSPPRFSFGVAHKNRAWAAGNYAAPSRLYYSGNTDPEDWTGGGSGSIDIDPSDGDMITGLVSHKDELWVFKGPNKGSIHRITGTSPSDFARKNFVAGLGACWHNAIFRFADDIGFVSQYGSVHSLSATAAYGDFFEASLSKRININWIRQHLNYNRLRNIWTATDPQAGIVYITASWDSNTTNNTVLAMDYRNAPDILRWSKIPSYDCASLGTFVDTNGVRRVLAGGNDGFVRRLNMPDRSIDGASALSYKVTTPFFNYGDPMVMKTLHQGAIGIAPKGNYNFTLGWQRDGAAQQMLTVAQGGADVLGTAASNQFTLDTSTLGGALFVDRYHEYNEQGGEFRSVQYQVTDAAISQDIELHTLTSLVHVDAVNTENS